MSAAFKKALAQGKVVVRKRSHVVGEVMIHFRDKDHKPIFLRSLAPIELTNKVGVDKKALLRSNVQTLLAEDILEIVSNSVPTPEPEPTPATLEDFDG